jgi:hypothetical protein
MDPREQLQLREARASPMKQRGTFKPGLAPDTVNAASKEARATVAGGRDTVTAYANDSPV